MSRDRGWAITLLRPRTKIPSGSGWQQTRLSEEQLTQRSAAATNGQGEPNCGVVLGELSGGVLDCDLDGPEARELATTVLPGTACSWGRESSPDSHRIFQCGYAPGTVQFADPERGGDNAMLVELRGTGGQTMGPGSIHPTGEEVRWYGKGEPTRIDYFALKRAVVLLAVSALVVRNYPTKGNRHKFSLAFAGVLARVGVSASVAGKVINAVAALAGDEEAHARASAVGSTYRKFGDDQLTTGFPTFLGFFTKKVGASLGAWLDSHLDVFGKVAGERNYSPMHDPPKSPDGKDLGGDAEDSAPDGAPDGSDDERVVAKVLAAIGGDETQAQAIVRLASPHDLFRCDDVAYASVPVRGHGETYPIRSPIYASLLRQAFYESTGSPANPASLQSAILTLESKAIFDGREIPVHRRLAEHDGCIYVFFGDDAWSAIKISRDGWEVATAYPVRFLKPRGMKALPTPTPGGNIEMLRPFVNVTDDGDWALLLGWLVAAMRPTGPYPVLCLFGEQGSAKSTTGRVIRSLVDPSVAPLRAEPREARDLAIAASNAWMLAYDNLSKLPPWLSDGMCRISTGGGFATRQLYTDSDETLLDFVRPILVNGIDDGLVGRSDLLDRAIIMTLPPVPENKRRPESELWREFEEAKPAILGALCDAVSTAMRNLPTVRLDTAPRMMDFALWAVAAEPGLGLPEGAFLDAYLANRENANAQAIESAAIGTPLLSFLQDNAGWTGTASELLEQLDSESYTDERLRRAPWWPKTARAIAGQIRRIAPNLRASGFEVRIYREPGGQRSRMISFESEDVAEPSRSSRPSRNQPGAPENADSAGTVGTQTGTVAENDRPEENHPGAIENAGRDGRDDRDGHIPSSTSGVEDDFVAAGMSPQDAYAKVMSLCDAAEEAEDTELFELLRGRATRLELRHGLCGD